MGIEKLRKFIANATDREKWQENKPTIVKGVVGGALSTVTMFCPMAGVFTPFLSEGISSAMPNRRMDQIEKIQREFDSRISELEESLLREQVQNPSFVALAEECLAQTARTISDERARNIAALIYNGLHGDEMTIIAMRRFVAILAELSDIEVLVLSIKNDSKLIGWAQIEMESQYLGPLGWSSVMGEAAAGWTIIASFEHHLKQLGLLDDDDQITNLGFLFLKSLDLVGENSAFHGLAIRDYSPMPDYDTVYGISRNADEIPPQDVIEPDYDYRT